MDVVILFFYVKGWMKKPTEWETMWIQVWGEPFIFLLQEYLFLMDVEYAWKLLQEKIVVNLGYYFPCHLMVSLFMQ